MQLRKNKNSSLDESLGKNDTVRCITTLERTLIFVRYVQCTTRPSQSPCSLSLSLYIQVLQKPCMQLRAYKLLSYRIKHGRAYQRVRKDRGRERAEMATNRAAEMMLQCVFNGNLSLHDMHKERRPYHRDCDCALHKLKGTVCSDAYCSQKRNVSFPNNKKKQSWSDCSLSMSAVSSKFSFSIPSSS